MQKYTTQQKKFSLEKKKSKNHIKPRVRISEPWLERNCKNLQLAHGKKSHHKKHQPKHTKPRVQISDPWLERKLQICIIQQQKISPQETSILAWEKTEKIHNSTAKSLSRKRYQRNILSYRTPATLSSRKSQNKKETPAAKASLIGPWA